MQVSILVLMDTLLLRKPDVMIGLFYEVVSILVLMDTLLLQNRLV